MKKWDGIYDGQHDDRDIPLPRRGMSVLKAHPEDNVFRIYSLRVAFALIVDPHTIHGPPRDSRSSSSVLLKMNSSLSYRHRRTYAGPTLALAYTRAPPSTHASKSSDERALNNYIELCIWDLHHIERASPLPSISKCSLGSISRHLVWNLHLAMDNILNISTGEGPMRRVEVSSRRESTWAPLETDIPGHLLSNFHLFTSSLGDGDIRTQHQLPRVQPNSFEGHPTSIYASAVVSQLKTA
ncbi:hypothetical protein CC1G_09636 [Coprinopsis cinerea okayama7|uniref:Uncharacterized protein n=1 Tax=Coprinopsis cinerea (strain Okayama-7 / 130 / ATCC MYA-4618 / FGSC 9003) TaxID=240176 RepID=A8N4F2_COPC7|nr:hypothetical protein CC1G_09636 [Coprinopsis cinerea okayama7\|eukprot:XP_001829747.2 hypothetical protein CC1G_09636 [Coprinopsis cinerea okayama7\